MFSSPRWLIKFSGSDKNQFSYRVFKPNHAPDRSEMNPEVLANLLIRVRTRAMRPYDGLVPGGRGLFDLGKCFGRRAPL